MVVVVVVVMVKVVAVVCQCELGEDWKGLRRDVAVKKERKTGASRDGGCLLYTSPSPRDGV